MANPIQAAQLKLVFTEAGMAFLQQVADELNTNLALYGLDTVARKAHFFGQVRQECGAGLQAAVESLQYSPQALVAHFGYYQSHPGEATTDGYVRDPVSKKITRPANQQAIANKVYANRIGNGDIASGDGWRYRGRGLIQVTGRSNYRRISQQCATLYPGGGVDFEAGPDTMAAFPGAVRSAIGYWTVNGLPKLADHGITGDDVDHITAVINKNTDSYAERRDNFMLALQAFS